MKRASTTFASVASLVGVVALSPACDQFEGRFSDENEFSAGGADPYSFPPAYRGTGHVRQTAASGTFTEVGGFVDGEPIGYFQFPFSPSQILTQNYPNVSANAWPEGVIDPLRVSGPGTDFRQSLNNPVPVPSVYNFDPPGNDDPFPPGHRCKAPPNYVHNRFLEGVPLDEQWNVFTFLPDRFTSWPIGSLPTWSYRPVVAEVPVATQNLDCQQVKSERRLLQFADEGKLGVARGEPEKDKRFGVLGKPNGRYLAWALIDPGAAVARVGTRVDVLQGGSITGSGIQKYGWYGQFIVAYIDGGYIPTEPGPNVAGAPTERMRVQKLYYPRSPVYRDGAAPASAAPGNFGQGYDVLQGNRFGDDSSAYSPVCELWSYTLPGSTAIGDLPKDEATILALANSTLEPARVPVPATAFNTPATIVPRYIFCLQAAPRAEEAP
ncbi:MAG: hypothetical protein KIT84_23320 [Labilithrix sp.]|nr:hypothetical protein [Labilithrix sp.]MCW5813978.1 hypothetical protein [Labilithrix sp.]